MKIDRQLKKCKYMSLFVVMAMGNIIGNDYLITTLVSDGKLMDNGYNYNYTIDILKYFLKGLF